MDIRSFEVTLSSGVSLTSALVLSPVIARNAPQSDPGRLRTLLFHGIVLIGGGGGGLAGLNHQATDARPLGRRALPIARCSCCASPRDG